MTMPLTMECAVHFARGRGGRKVLVEGAKPIATTDPGRIARVARWMALAIRCEASIRSGAIGNYAELASLGQVSRARVSQIMNLLNLAPDIQDAVLHLPRTVTGRDPIRLRDLQPIASTLDWTQQRKRWQTLKGMSPVEP